MRPPAFWQAPTPTLAAHTLHPLASLYGALAARRLARVGARAALPVLCVGNFTLGGAGKTPTALALAALLRSLGEEPAFLSRGYGGTLAGPVRVDPEAHGAVEVGDEPLLLARSAPTVVARQRPTGAALCAALGASVIVMDDGLQNPSLIKDLALAVVDAEVGVGNALSFPAGPLRAPLGAQWPLVQALVLVGRGAPGERLARDAAERGLPVLRGALTPDPATAARLAGQRVLAFAGIGRPEKFFATLRGCGAQVVAARAFADHHAYGMNDVQGLAREAAARSLRLVTTEKDLVRLAGSDALRSFALDVVALPVRLALEAEGALRELVVARLRMRREAT